MTLILTMGISAGGVCWVTVPARGTDSRADKSNSAGVAQDWKPSEKPESPPRFEEVLVRYNAQTRKWKTLEVRNLQINAGQDGKGLAVMMSGMLACMKAHRLRCSAYMAGSPVFDLISSEKGYHYSLYKNIPATMLRPWGALGTNPADYLLEMLGMSELTVADGLEVVSERVKGERKYTKFTLYYGPDRHGISRIVRLEDNGYIHLTNISFYDEHKQRFWGATLSDWQGTGDGVSVPTTIRIDGEKQLCIQLKLKDLIVNGTIDAEREGVLFALPKRDEAGIHVIVAPDQIELQCRGATLLLRGRTGTENTLKLLQLQFDIWVKAARPEVLKARITARGDVQFETVQQLLELLKQSGVRESSLAIAEPNR